MGGNAVDNNNCWILPQFPIYCWKRFPQIQMAVPFELGSCKIGFLLVYEILSKCEAILSPWTWLISELEDRISSASFWAVGSTSVWWAVIRYWTSFCSWSLFIWNNVSEMGNRSLTCSKHRRVSDMAKSRIWAGLWAYSTGCMDVAPPKKSQLERVTFTGEAKAKTASASIWSIEKVTVQHQLHKQIWEITLRFTTKWGHYKEDPSVFHVCYLFRFADSVKRQRHHMRTVENIFVATAAGHRGDFASVEADSHLVGDFWLWGRGGLSYCPTEMKACNDSRQEKESLVTLLSLVHFNTSQTHK